MDKGTLFIRLHSLGDIVLASGTAASAASRGPVAFAVAPEYVPVVERIPGGVTPVPFFGGIRGLRRLASGYSRIVDLQNSFATSLALAGMERSRFSFSRVKRRRILHGSCESLPWRASEYLRTYGEEGSCDPVLDRRGMPPGDERRVGIVCGGRWPLKSIPAGVIHELARLFSDNGNTEVLLIGAPDDAAAVREAEEQSSGRNVRAVICQGGIDELLCTVECLNLLVSPDSGPAHVAMALGVPVQVVFTSTSPSLGFYPLGMKGLFMARDLPCRPCHRHGGRSCPKGHSRCRRRLVPMEMFREALCLIP